MGAKTLKKLFYTNIFICIFIGLFKIADAQSLSVDATDYKQTIDMIGGDMERSSNAIQSAQNKDEIIDWAFKDIDFNVCRVRYDKSQELVEGSKNWDFYAKQITSMQMVKASNPDIKFFASPRTDYDGYGDESNLPDWICNYTTKAVDAQKYGVFLADYVEYMNEQGVPIAYLSTMKEWANFITAAVAKDVIESLDSTLEVRCISKPLIIDQGFWSLSKGISYLEDIKELGSKDKYYAFCSHNYKKEDGTKWDAFIDAASNLGKAVYNDETGGGYGGPTYGVEPEISSPLAAYIEKCVAYKSGLKGEVFFEIWSRGINKETRAIYFPWSGEGQRMRGYYIMKQFANNILNSQYVTSTISAMPDVYSMSFRSENKLVLWIINNSNSDYYSLPVSISNETINGQAEHMYWTAATPISGSIEFLTIESGNFTPTIAAQSLNCFVVGLETVTSAFDLYSDKLVVYPTLVKDGFVRISNSYMGGEIQIFDLNGRIAKQITVSGSKINVSELKSGMYLVCLQVDEKQYTQKIIIE